jgi:nucleoside recognition membrane protein YjiH
MFFYDVYSNIHDFVIYHPLLTLAIIVVLVCLFLKKPKNLSTWIIGIIGAAAVFYFFNMYQGSLYNDSGEKKDFINLPKLEKSDN